MNTKYINILLVLIISVISSCTERIELDLDDTYARLVVDGQITNAKTKHWVKLRRSGNALNTIPSEHVSNAVITISDGSQVFELIENPNKPGLYETGDSVQGIPGKVYVLSIKNVDIDNNQVPETYSASCALKLLNPIDTITLVPYNMGHNKGNIINMYGQEIGGGRNFYMLKAYKNNVLVTDSVYEITFSDNLGFEGKYYDGYSVYFLSNEKEDEKINKGDTITLELSIINKEYFEFLNAFIAEYYPKVPIFSGPSANVPTNIEPADKAVGFFTAHMSVTKTTIVK